MAGLVICAAELLTGCPCGCVWVLSGAAELCLLSLLLLDAGLAVIDSLTVVCFCASSCGAGGLSAACPAAGYPYGVTQTFLAPVACPAPAVELCLLVCGVFDGALGFPPCVVLFFRDLRFWAASPAAGFLPEDSAAVCLTCYCAGGFGWAATLPLCSQCFSCAGWPAGVRWVLHPVSGSSHWGCDCSLGDSVGVPYGSPSLSSFVFLLCHLLLQFSPSVGTVLCSLLVFPCLRVGVLLACGVYGACSRWGLLSRLPLVVVLLRSLLVLHLLLRWGGYWFGHTSVAPPAAPVCWALVGSLLRCSVALGSCAPYPVGSSLVDSHGFVVQAPGVFLASLLWLFPLASGVYGWLGVVVTCTS